MTPIAARPASTAPQDGAAAARGRTPAADTADGAFAEALDAAAASSETAAGGPVGPRADETAVAEPPASGDGTPPSGQLIVADAATRLDTWNAWLIWSGRTVEEGSSAEPAVIEPDAPPTDDDPEVAVEAARDGDATSAAAAVPFAVAIPGPVSAAPTSHGDPGEQSVDVAAGLPSPADVRDAPQRAAREPQTAAREDAVRRASGSAPMPALAPPSVGEPRTPDAAAQSAPAAQLQAIVTPAAAGASTLDTHASDVPPQPAARPTHAHSSFEAAVLDRTGFAGDAPAEPAVFTAEARTSQDAPGPRSVDPSPVARTEPAVSFSPETAVVPAASPRTTDAAEMTAPAAQASGGEAASAVVEQIVKSLRMQWKQGLGEARIQLRPEHLGPVDISLKVEAGAVTAVVRADSTQVQEWILGNQQSLRQQLEAAGLRLDDLVVSPDPERRRQRDQETPADRRAAPRRRREGEPEPIFNVVV